jgi:hypothetical protein
MRKCVRAIRWALAAPFIALAIFFDLPSVTMEKAADAIAPKYEPNSVH